jgi:hypothetical protein
MDDGRVPNTNGGFYSKGVMSTTPLEQYWLLAQFADAFIPAKQADEDPGDCTGA